MIVSFKTGEVWNDRKIKSEIMKLMGLDPESAADTKKYQREYDKLRNKIRNYERITGQDTKSIKVNEYMYKQQKAMKRYGKDYKPSGRAAAIAASSSGSPGRAKPGGAKTAAAVAGAIAKQFAGLIRDRKEAARIAEEAKDDPKSLYQGLKEYAERLQEARKNAYDKWRLQDPNKSSKLFDWYSMEESSDFE